MHNVRLFCAGGSSSNLPSLDGLNMWPSLSEDLESPRNLMLHNIDESRNIAALRIGDWKLVKGTTYQGSWDTWNGPSGRQGTYKINKIFNSEVAKSISGMRGIKIPPKPRLEALRQQANIHCEKPRRASLCKPLQQACLFNITADPCEFNNLVFNYPDVVRTMERTLEMYKATEVPRGNKPIDPRADPKFYDYTWTNWWDYISH